MKKRVLLMCGLLVLGLTVAACGKKEEVSTESVPVEQETMTEETPDLEESSQDTAMGETAEVEETEDIQMADESEMAEEEGLQAPKEIEVVQPAMITTTQTETDGSVSYTNTYYDEDGDIVKTENASGAREYEYLRDENGNKIKGIDYMAARNVTYEEMGYVSLLKNQKVSAENSTYEEYKYEYDEDNRMIRMDYCYVPTNHIETTSFEHADNQVFKQYNDVWGVTRKEIMQFNEMGYLLYNEYDDTNQEPECHCINTYTYNEANQIVKEERITEVNGEKKTSIQEYSYDEKGNLVSGKSDWSYDEYTYDENNNLVNVKKYSTDGGLYFATINEYDSDNNLLSKTVYEETVETVFTCSYDENGNLLVVNVSDEPYFEFTYDEQGRLKKATQCNDNPSFTAVDIANEYIEKRTGMEGGFDINFKLCYEYTY